MLPMRSLSKTRRSCDGLTLLELLFVLAVAAVIAAAAIPGLQHARMNMQRHAAINGLTGIIQLARSVAQSSGATVVLCKADQQDRCAASGRRWQLALSESGKPLRALASDYLEFTAANRVSFEFRPFPLRSTNGTISICDPRGGAHQREIIISYTGRPRTIHPATANGTTECPPE